MVPKFSYISKIFVDGIRSFKDFELELDPGLNMLVGPNAVGKSTLLQILSYFLSGKFSGGRYLSIFDLFKNYYSENEKLIPFIVFETSAVKLDSHFMNDVWSETLMCTLTVDKDAYMKDVKEILIGDMKGDKTLIRSGILKLSDVGNREASFLIALIGSGASYNERVLVRVGDSIYYIYQSRDFGSDKLLDKLRITSLSYNYSDHKNILFNTLEGKKQMRKHFDEVVKNSNILINKLSKDKNYEFLYRGKPEIPIKILDSQGRNVENASSGEKQLNDLDLFFDTVDEVKPSVVVIDEPELHLNYSQLPFLISKIKRLLNRNVQVLIATHSTFFIRWTNIGNIKLLKIHTDSVKNVKLGDKKLLQKYFIFPEIFFCRKIIAVESVADKIFYERTLGVMAIFLDNRGLDQRNIEIVAGYGKTYMHNIRDLSNSLGTDYFFIVDLDFFLQEIDFSFFGRKFVNAVNVIRKQLIKLNNKESGARIFSLNSESKADFFDLINKVFKSRTVTKDDTSVYNSRFKSLVEKYTYEPRTGLAKIISDIRIDKIRTIFREKNVWLLRTGSIDNYVNSSLKEGGKLSIDKLQLSYYPSKFSDLSAFMSQGAIDEFKKLAEEISRWDR